MERTHSIPSRSPAGRAQRRLAVCAAAALYLALACGPDAVERTNAKVELRSLTSALVASVEAGDEAGIDEAVCLDWLARAQAARRERLGLASTPPPPTCSTGSRRATANAYHADS